MIWVSNTGDTAFDRIHLIKSACTRLFTTQEIDKKNKKKGRLGIGNGIIVFGSEVDKVKAHVSVVTMLLLKELVMQHTLTAKLTHLPLLSLCVQSPVRHWLIKNVINVRHEKSHVYLDLGGASLASIDFKAASKQEAMAISNKIQKSRILYYVTSPASTSLVHHFMSVPTYQTAQVPYNASASRTCHHGPRTDVLAAPSPSPTRSVATRPVRVVNSRYLYEEALSMVHLEPLLMFLFVC